MTTLQKTLFAATITVLIGSGIYQATEGFRLRGQVGVLRSERASLAKEVTELQGERDAAQKQLAAVREANALLRSNTAELPRLRGEVAQLRAGAEVAARSRKSDAANDAVEVALRAWVGKTKELGAALQAQPGLVIPEFELLDSPDWLQAAMELDTEDPDGLREAANTLRRLATDRLATQMGPALHRFLAANDDVLPAEVRQLKSYFDRPVTDEMLKRYRMIRQGRYSDLPPLTMVLTEIAPVDNDRSRVEVGVNGWHHTNWLPADPASAPKSTP